MKQDVWANAAGGLAPLSQESQLLLYALSQQVNEGPCMSSAPWSWNVVESAKHQAWKQLGECNKMEAMRLYVRTLDEEQVRACDHRSHRAAGPQARTVYTGRQADRQAGTTS